jgi:hypothetical protein
MSRSSLSPKGFHKNGHSTAGELSLGLDARSLTVQLLMWIAWELQIEKLMDNWGPKRWHFMLIAPWWRLKSLELY